ncbi:MAG: Holliday junction resolvase RuvX [Clostridiales bacterium]|jgi:putative Holliday junction resolvase|nr:Holliday junction resolvase RuvX [Clostridiales bacterium]
MRVLGLDYGDRRIGVALSDALGWTAGGLLTLARKNPIDHRACIEAIGRIIEEYTISIIVLGYPRNMDGSEGENCRKVKAFAAKLAKAHPTIQIEFFDERLSSSRALQIFHEQGINAKKRGQGSLDKMAAQVILQGFLDSRSASKNIDKEKKTMTEKNEHFGETIFDMDDVEMEALVVTDDEGNELEYIIIDEFEHGGMNYLVMVKADEVENDEVEAAIFKQMASGEEEYVFEEINEDEYANLEEMLKARLEDFGIDLE